MVTNRQQIIFTSSAQKYLQNWSTRTMPKRKGQMEEAPEDVTGGCQLPLHQN
jgi:hypothetical protein